MIAQLYFFFGLIYWKEMWFTDRSHSFWLFVFFQPLLSAVLLFKIPAVKAFLRWGPHPPDLSELCLLTQGSITQHSCSTLMCEQVLQKRPDQQTADQHSVPRGNFLSGLGPIRSRAQSDLKNNTGFILFCMYYYFYHPHYNFNKCSRFELTSDWLVTFSAVISTASLRAHSNESH